MTEDYTGKNFADKDLSKSDFGNAVLYRANFTDANLSGVNLAGADMIKADFEGANLREANLCDADLYRANLKDANMWDALYNQNTLDTITDDSVKKRLIEVGKKSN